MRHLCVWWALVLPVLVQWGQGQMWQDGVKDMRWISEISGWWSGFLALFPTLYVPSVEGNKVFCTPPYPTSLLPDSSGFGWHSSWGLENFLLSSEVTAFCLQAKYMVRRVSWWTCTALARAWGSRPLLCPDMWLPSPLKRKNERSPSW